jgi:phytoene dehydrogenase-like protein
MHDYWEEVGLIRGREFIYMDEYMRFEGEDGKPIIFYSDVDKLEKELLRFSPQDSGPISDFIDGIRMCLKFEQPSVKTPVLKRYIKQVSAIYNFIKNGKKLRRWMNVTCNDFANRFRNPLLMKAFNEMWVPEFSMLFMLFTFAYLHNKSAGYPLGGSLPMSKALEERYKALGGIINYNKKVEKIITEGGDATGIRLDDGTEFRSSKVISAADGYSTIFKMLEGRFTDEKIRTIYEKWLPFPPLIFVGIGVNRSFRDLPLSVSGFSYQLKEPAEIGEAVRDRLYVHIYNHDPSMAPEGKTTITLMLNTDYDYWKELARDKTAYNNKKKEIGERLVELLDQRFPGISSQVEMIDVATPATFERYTGNWKGSFEGWLITPENAKTIMKPMSQSLPGLQNFYLCGQWVEPGGGLPTGVMSARRLIKTICKGDGKKFRTTI